MLKDAIRNTEYINILNLKQYIIISNSSQVLLLSWPPHIPFVGREINVGTLLAVEFIQRDLPTILFVLSFIFLALMASPSWG